MSVILLNMELYGIVCLCTQKFHGFNVQSFHRPIESFKFLRVPILIVPIISLSHIPLFIARIVHSILRDIYCRLLI